MPESRDTPELRRYAELEGRTFLLGVGGMKCATSWVFDYLAQDPAVAATPLKELHFFTSRRRPQGAQPFTPHVARLVRDHLDHDPQVTSCTIATPRFQTAVDMLQMLYDDNAYFGHFARLARPETRVFTEITPQYALLGPDGFSYVRDVFASQDLTLKVFFILRDPVARLWSHLRSLQEQDQGIDPLRDWAQLIRQREVITRSDYWGTIEALDAVFPPDQILYLFYEDLIGGDGVSSLCQFAGLPQRPADTGTRHNETRLAVPMSGHVQARLTKILAPQYRFCRDRFGDVIPEVWQG